MKARLAPDSEVPLLFQWEGLRGRSILLLWFLAASVIGHAICFYLFQITYPPTVALLPPPTRVSLVSPGSEEGKTLLHWIEAEDPALAFTTIRPTGESAFALPDLQHVPLYMQHEPQLKPIPPQKVDLRIPSAHPPGPVPMARQTVFSPVAAAPTSVSFSEELTALGQAIFPQGNFSASTNEPPQSLRFRIAVNQLGEIQYCFPANSSGDAALDEQARKFLALCRFPSASSPIAEDSLRWGYATVEWGSDVARAAATPSSSAAQ